MYLGPADEAGRAKAGSKLLQGLQACLDDLGVAAQPQVVVCTEVKDPWGGGGGKGVGMDTAAQGKKELGNGQCQALGTPEMNPIHP